VDESFGDGCVPMAGFFLIVGKEWPLVPLGYIGTLEVSTGRNKTFLDKMIQSQKNATIFSSIFLSLKQNARDQRSTDATIER